VAVDRLSITDAIGRIADALRLRRRVSFAELLEGAAGGGRPAVIAAFLAVLEMARLRLVRVFQAAADEAGPDAEIVVEARETLVDGTAGPKGVEDYR
jgi:segregation and condensation protein A